MKRYLTILAVAVFLISATAVTTSTIITQPKVPKSVKVIKTYQDNPEGALQTYTNIGYVVKTCNYNSSGVCFIILEKY